MSRKRGRAETPEYVQFARRAARGLMLRVKDADLEDVVDAVQLVAEIEVMLGEALEEWVASQQHLPQLDRNRTWTLLGNALGVSRQAVEQRFTKAGRARAAKAQAKYRQAVVARRSPAPREVGQGFAEAG